MVEFLRHHGLDQVEGALVDSEAVKDITPGVRTALNRMAEDLKDLLGIVNKKRVSPHATGPYVRAYLEEKIDPDSFALERNWDRLKSIIVISDESA